MTKPILCVSKQVGPRHDYLRPCSVKPSKRQGYRQSIQIYLYLDVKIYYIKENLIILSTMVSELQLFLFHNYSYYNIMWSFRIQFKFLLSIQIQFKILCFTS